MWVRLSLRYGVPVDELKASTTPTRFYQLVGYLEDEPNQFNPEYRYLAQIAWYQDVTLHVLCNMFNRNPPEFTRTIDDHVLKFTTEKPEYPGKVKFTPPVIRGGKVVEEGEPLKALPAQDKLPTNPHRKMTLTADQEQDAKVARSKAIWGRFKEMADAQADGPPRRRKPPTRNPENGR